MKDREVKADLQSLPSAVVSQQRMHSVETAVSPAATSVQASQGLRRSARRPTQQLAAVTNEQGSGRKVSASICLAICAFTHAMKDKKRRASDEIKTFILKRAKTGPSFP